MYPADSILNLPVGLYWYGLRKLAASESVRGYTGDPAAEAWVAEQMTKILEGKAAQVAAGIGRRATRFGYAASERADADTCADYLSAKKPYLGSDLAPANGWPIATGAARHLVKDRMDITGPRWGLAGVEAILRLRALAINGDLDVLGLPSAARARTHPLETLPTLPGRIHACRMITVTPREPHP